LNLIMVDRNPSYFSTILTRMEKKRTPPSQWKMSCFVGMERF
jgi:hypothetical protein